MDHKTVQFYVAAKEGNVKNLKAQIGFCKKEEVRLLVESKTDGATPLVIAARNGHIDVVRFLVEFCDADVESSGTVTFGEGTAEKASPLWCAAAVGRLDIVKYLIKKSADVNHTTFNSTNGAESNSLRVACFYGHSDTVKYLVANNADVEFTNKYGSTCLMISCCNGPTDVVKYLLSKGADVNKKDKRGSTALHHCAGSKLGSQEIMELLLQHEARMEEDNEGITPLFVAANTGHVHLVEYLMKRDTITEKERIEALELLGASLYSKKDISGAVEYWKQALQHRQPNSQNPIAKPELCSWVATYEGVKEFETSEELDELRSNTDGMRMAIQCLLIRERILGPTHCETINEYRRLGVFYFNKRNFAHWFMLYMYALDTEMNKQERLSQTTQFTLEWFTRFYSVLVSNKLNRFAKFREICEVFSKAIIELERGREALMADSNPSEEDKNRFCQIIKILLHLMSVICRLCTFRKPSPQEDNEFKNLVRKLIKMDPKDSKDQSLLHLAVQKTTTNIGNDQVSTFPCMRCVKLLTSLGMPLNSVDEDGKTAYDLAYDDYIVDYDLLVKLKCT